MWDLGMVANETEGRAEALRRVAACRDAHAEELDLGGLRLTALDGELLTALCQLGWLRRLLLGLSVEVREKQEFSFLDGISDEDLMVRNALREVPGALFDALTRLERLDLALNGLLGLSASIANLTTLTRLDLTYNKIGAEGALALKGLVNLTSLDLSYNHIGPKGVQALKGLVSLTSLNLSFNDIGPEGVQALKSLVNLTSLNLSFNDIGPEGVQALKGLVGLTSLNLRNNDIGAKEVQALKGLVNLTSLNLDNNRLGAEGVQALKGLVNLTSLDLGKNFIGAEGAQALKGLVNLTSLNLDNNRIGAEGAQALKGLVNLTSLNLDNNRIGPEGVQVLRGLVGLTSLELSNNHIGPEGVQALKGLVNLTSLGLQHNRIGAEATQALKGLVNLTSLNLSVNEIGAEGAQALKGLINLTSLWLSSNEIGPEGVQALKGLLNLTSLELSNNDIGADGVQVLKGLVNLTRLNLRRNRIRAEGAQVLKGLVSLTILNLSNNDIGPEGVQAIKGLVNLTRLELAGNDIGPEGVQALRGLVNLINLDLRRNRVGDISPLVSLHNLRAINLSYSHLDYDVPAFWMLPSLQGAILYKACLPGVPVEILSKDEYGDNCLERLRAHFADLTGDDVAVGDVKLMILGNGRVGKTQICRRLRGESFDEAVPSTHGIQISSQPFAQHVLDAPVTLKIWDFGGQDIYHGTHALFLKSRAIFPVVWTPGAEAEQFHTHGGFTFRNQPLAYWLAYVRTFGGARSPLLVVQSQCDRPEDEREPPLPPGALDGIGYKKVLHHGAKGDGTHARGHAALEETLLDAVRWMRVNQGVAKIGPGRAAAKEALEAKLAAGHRLISHQGYLDLCAKVEQIGKGRISDPALLLEYLHNIGTVFYRKGVFGDQIVLDQAWALDAVYAVFDRASHSLKKIERNRGRFRRSELAEWAWQKHGVPEQELFLSFMQQCGICFTIQREDREKRVEAEYIAPDLLPARSDDETQKRLRLVWDEAGPEAEAVLTFSLLPPGLMRALIAWIGSGAGLAAEYWRDGVCFYDEKTASRALIEQRWREGWAGEVHIATKGGQAGALLQRLIGLVENDRISLGARPSGKKVTAVEANVDARKGSDAKADELPVRPAHEPSKVIEYYVSYAWGDDSTEGKEREGMVDRLCSVAEAGGKCVIRDKTAMKIGDRISTFMDRIGKGAVNGRVCIVLSDKYLRSAYCMHELFDVWRNCREDGGTFIDRARVFVLPSAKIATAVERAQYVIHWQKTFKALDALVKEHGQFVLSDTDNAEFRLMSRFTSETANVLQLVQDILRPRSFDDYVNHVFD
jgi:internalin A